MELPKELIKTVSEVTGECFDESKLMYGDVIQSYLNMKNYPSSLSIIFAPIFPQKLNNYRKVSESFNEFERLIKYAKIADKKQEGVQN